MARNEERFTITDDYGAAHEYFVTQHPATEGLRLFNQIFKIIAPSIGRVFSLAGIAQGVQNPLDVELSDLELGKAFLGGIDGAAAVDAFRELAEVLIEHGTPELYIEILKYTGRNFTSPDPKRPTQGDWRQLVAPGVFDESYQGNYGELAAAVWHVLKANYSRLFTARLARLFQTKRPPAPIAQNGGSNGPH